MLNSKEKKLIDACKARAHNPQFVKSLFAAFTTTDVNITLSDLELAAHRQLIFGSAKPSPSGLNAFFQKNAGQRYSIEITKAIAKAVQHYKRKFDGELLYTKGDSEIPCNLTALWVAERELECFRVMRLGTPAKEIARLVGFPEHLHFNKN